MGIHDRIRQKRLEMGMTLDEVARALGTTRQTIQKYESGVISNIPAEKVEQMARVFEVPPAYLMGWAETESEDEDLRMIARQYKRLAPSDQQLLKGLLASMSKAAQEAMERDDDDT